ncbi:MAG TPA: 5-formyltetrahydrofolate cyclo-ligase [Elusimicrobiota bacterium]|nr:5-formyltetrahydrofolate cyclo-ligase [Elusimicrobiota bacterium]
MPSEEILRHKSFLRSFFRHAVRSLSAAKRRQESRAVIRRAGKLPVFQRARTVAVTLSRPWEIDTGPFLALCRKRGKRVVVPVVFPAGRRLRFVDLEPHPVLRKNVHGILEPAAPSRTVPLKKIDLMVVPGAAFTPQKHRLGSGGGYYDRVLENFPASKTAGFAFSVQLAPRLPVEPHDRRVGVLVTPRRLFR